jgi:ubiquitin-conjugating enzyme E2 G1
MSRSATLLLKKQLGEILKSGTEGFSAGLAEEGNLQKWQIVIMGPPDTVYEGGFFKALLDFPDDYPNKPPKMRFVTPIWHPNISTDGDVCISILHEPGEDRWGYETPQERWLPVHTVETIITSVISMLAEPNADSPANVDAAKEFRHNYTEFKRKVWDCVRKSQENFD